MAKKRIEDIAIDRSKSFKRQLKKDLSTSKEQASRNIDVSISLSTMSKTLQVCPGFC